MMVERTDPEWSRMWEALRESGEDIDAAEPESGERWQYISTARNDQGQAIHTFRHRYHPKTGRREYAGIVCTAEFLSRVDVQPLGGRA